MTRNQLKKLASDVMLLMFLGIALIFLMAGIDAILNNLN